MCDGYSNVLIEIPTSSMRGPDGNKRAIDACLAPLVQVLNNNGYATLASCCGHGRQPGSIVLADGRELFIADGYDIARRFDKRLAEGSTDAD